MANHASAVKAYRQSLKRREINKQNRSSLRTALKRFSELLKSGKTEDAKASLTQLYASIDKGVQKNSISANAAARQKSRLTRHLNEALSGTK